MTDISDKLKQLLTVSNPNKVITNAIKYFNNPDVKIYLSNKENSKYMVLSPNNKWVHFGDIRYEDFTKHKNLIRRDNYLKRTANIRGSWKNDKYSKNNLSRVLLWDAPF